MFRKTGGQSEPKKASYEAQYLGWKQCPSMTFDESMYPIVQSIITKRQADISSGVNSLQITVSKKEFKIVQQLTRNSGKSSKVEKYKFPPIPTCDVTNAIQCMSPETVAIIILGYNTSTERYLHVHVFRFNSSEIALSFVNHLTDIIKLPSNQQRLKMIEIDLHRQGEIGVSHSQPSHKHVRSRSIDSSPNSAADSLALELQRKLRVTAAQQPLRNSAIASELDTSGPPILLPPRDYDTISRSHGDSILHHHAIAVQRNAMDSSSQENAGSLPPDADYNEWKRSSGMDSPSSAASSSHPSSGFNTPQLQRGSHSFGGSDLKSAIRRDKRQMLPFRNSDNMSSASWDSYRPEVPK